MLKILSTLVAVNMLFVSSAFAESTNAVPTTSDLQSFTTNLNAHANQKQVIRLLASRGYIVTSELFRDASGRWSGTALKDGKLVNVAIKLPQQAPLGNMTN